MESHRATGPLLDAVARTALWTAAARARESLRPDRLFSDPHAATLAGKDGDELLRHFHTERAPADGNPFLPIRTRWFDDQLTAAIGDEPAQVVALGAGLDTRWYRMRWPSGTTLFELDQAEVLAYKAKRLADVDEPTAAQRRLVTAYLDSPGWTQPLLDAGFVPRRATVWYAEGLLFYLPEQSAQRLLREACELSAPGSIVLADLIGTGIFDFAYTREFLGRLKAAGSPWQFGTDEPAAFLAEAGWQPRTVVEPGMPGADFDRWSRRWTLPKAATVPRSYLVSANR